MWGYKIPIGLMDFNGVTRPELCYSGYQSGKNNAAFCNDENVGPIPPGKWKFGTMYDSETHGPCVLPLSPLPGTNTFGRSGFLIHGDSLTHPGEASRGCIIAPRSVRLTMNASQDRVLEVIA